MQYSGSTEINLSKQRRRLSPVSPGLLYDLYVRKGKTAKELAVMFDVSERTIYDWIKRHGVYKTRADARQDWEFCKECGHLRTD